MYVCVLLGLCVCLCVCVLLGDLDSLSETARFLLLLSVLCQQQNRYEDRQSFMSKAKDVQDRSVITVNTQLIQTLKTVTHLEFHTYYYYICKKNLSV